MPSGKYLRTKDMMTGKHYNHKPWNKGKTGIISTKKGRHYPHLQEENSSAWLGDSIGYFGVHEWVIRWKGKPQKCEMCGAEDKKKYEWANIDHKYRRILDDYIRLCTKCHRNYDYSRKKNSETNL